MSANHASAFSWRFSYCSSNQLVTIEDPCTEPSEMVAFDGEENQEISKDLETERMALNEKEADHRGTSARWRIDTRVEAVRTAETRVGSQRKTRVWW